ncbi:MAG: VOC family protein [Clostridia bacterium]|nr:VOC family protein [Clostridia bacterium]
MIKGIEHIAVCSNDTKRLTDWYVKMFGWDIVYDNGKGTYFVKAADGSMLEIMAADGKDFTAEPNAGGLRHFALSIDDDDFDVMVDKLKAEGVEVVTDVVVSPKGIKTFFFRDIDGNIFHLIYRPIAL